VKRAAAACAIALASSAGIAEAGPWGQGKGRFYTNLAFESLDTTQLATPDGNIQTIPEFRLRQFGFYGAFGVSEDLTVIIDRIGARRSEIEDFDSASGFEDLRTGLQWQLGQRGAWILATRGIVQAPTGDETKGQGILPTGSGVWEGDARLSAGRSWLEGRLYGYGEAGHQFRGGALRDAFVYETQLGYWVHPRLLVGATLRGVQPYESEPSEEAIGSPSGLGDGVTYTVYAPMAIVHLGRGAGVQLEVEDAFNESNLATGVKFRIKIFFER
jgi:hypothetical protein